MNCPTCGKELYDNGEERFLCPFCGAEVEGSGSALWEEEVEGSGSAPEEEKEETLEMRCQRLERELERMKVKAAIEEQSATEHYWFRGGNLFSMLDRQSAREALERGDIESAKKHLASAEKSFNIGCLLYIAVIVVVLISMAYLKFQTKSRFF